MGGAYTRAEKSTEGGRGRAGGSGGAFSSAGSGGYDGKGDKEKGGKIARGVEMLKELLKRPGDDSLIELVQYVEGLQKKVCSHVGGYVGRSAAPHHLMTLRHGSKGFMAAHARAPAHKEMLVAWCGVCRPRLRRSRAVWREGDDTRCLSDICIRDIFGFEAVLYWIGVWPLITPCAVLWRCQKGCGRAASSARSHPLYYPIATCWLQLLILGSNCCSCPD